MPLPTNLRYTEEHEWIEDRDSVLRVGITQYAAAALGDIVYVQLPEVGEKVTVGQACGELESTKSVSDLYAPVTGEVLAVNEAVVEDPSLVNGAPYAEGWLLELRADETPELLTPEQYTELTGED